MGYEKITEDVINKTGKTNFTGQHQPDDRGWIVDIFNCVNKIEGEYFTLSQMYQFEEMLSVKYPRNHHIKDKIRQQLQILRDKGIIEFIGDGNYRKL